MKMHTLNLLVICSVPGAVMGIPGVADPANPAYTSFLAHYDGNTAHLGMDADFALGSPQVTSNGGTISANAKFGAGALDPSLNTTGVGNRTEYTTASNFNVNKGTVEMWIKSPWTGGAQTLFSIWTPAYQGEISMHRLANGRLLVMMDHANGYNTQWSQTVDPLTPVMADGEWHHLAWNWDFDQNFSTVYLDGYGKAFSVNNNPALNPPKTNFTGTLDPHFEVGTTQRGYNAFQGLIDEFRIANVALYGDQDFTPQSEAYVIGGNRWAGASGGSWSVSGNWLGGVPNAPGAAANFTALTPGAITVNVDAPQTVGVISFDSPDSYLLDGVSTITLDVSAGSASINVLQGVHAITAPLQLAKDTTVNVASPTAALSHSGVMSSATGVTLTKLGSGVFEVKHLRSGTVNLSAGVINVQPDGGTGGAGKVQNLSIAGSTDNWQASLDLYDNHLVINSGSITTIANQVKSGFHGGSWGGTGISSAVAAAVAADGGNLHKTGLGYALGSEVFGVGGGTFAGQSAGASAVLVAYTYLGDANLDRKVNTLDFNLLAGGFGGASPKWNNGDFNYNGAVDSIDFNALIANYGMVMATPVTSAALGATVPEPSIALWIAGAALLGRRRICR